MIVANNPKPSLSEFNDLMIRTDTLLNRDALLRPAYYQSHNGTKLEDDVVDALREAAKHTQFENTIEKISGQKFPDIVAAKVYGVEVKSTKEDQWKSTGSSILESTRVTDVERIYMTFGKLGGHPIEFLSRPYEQCLYDIAVTHMPRYLINMKLDRGETIFDKIGIPYDDLRQLENPVGPVSAYYKARLKPGERLWWTGSEEETVAAKIRLWKNLTIEEKHIFTAYGCINFPEVFSGDYDQYALWLTSQGVVDPHIRDQFSAGGQEYMKMSDGTLKKFPAVFRRLKTNMPQLLTILTRKDTESITGDTLSSRIAFDDRVEEWISSVSHFANVEYDVSVDALEELMREAKEAIRENEEYLRELAQSKQDYEFMKKIFS